MTFSPIIAGVMRWGSWGANHTEKKVQELIETALEQGFYTFDHADIYGGYTTESLFGRAISEMKIDRGSYQIITKCGIQYPGGAKPYQLKSYNYSKDYILKCVEESLLNLKTDYLDVFLLHRPSPLMDPEEIAAAFGILRSSGKVKDFGVSNFTVSQFDLVHSYFPFLVTNQVEISVNETKAFYDGTLDQMMMHRIRPMAYSVMGNYFSLPDTQQNQRLKVVLQQLYQKYQTEENLILLAFLLKHPAKIIPIVGTSNIQTLRKFAAAIHIELADEDWFRILEASRGHRVE